MRGVCDQLRADLAECLKKSDCMRVHGHSGNECLSQYRDTLPLECQQAYRGFVECKRSLWDMRKRFRGIPGAEYSTSSTVFGALDKRWSDK
ncbi:Similar to S.cerevisiae protein PET191 (Protein required for assembly of cytochrome c oxidase) [Malassezia sympodialis ATCC 42132]|uniref:Similar to S.cerevisiae protein PET191 (Protein required for assembly of cytochrome c oxidase) n=1 Tax=Malassezia sympodialis (strain ATCC 42132) TaxID=1230383 RepID=A0A1M8AA48_MALS4|nr:Similar to S.cerevisiae protein PET191 (Protein required for assembly of cytochrome c oxidase) [Malassezia sympodialis ATCC 42132]